MALPPQHLHSLSSGKVLQITQADSSHSPVNYVLLVLTTAHAQVLREQLGPGELDAAARVCKAWAAQLAHDVVHCEMCMPASHEQLLCQLEQLGRRFRNVHSWHLWLPAGADWAAIDDQRLLWLLSRCG